MKTWVAIAALVLIAGCRKDSTSASASGAAAASAAGAAAASASAGPLAIFSAPIAGAQVGGGEAIAVGLVVAQKAIVAARVDGEGRAKWSRAIVDDVAWSQDAELHAWPIRAGAVVTWRGKVHGKPTHVRVVIAADGRVIEGPADVGSLVCATDEGLAWSEGEGSGKTRVHLRAWADGGARDETSDPIDGDFTLTCGAKRAYAVAEGDEGIPTRVVAVGGARGPALVVAPEAMGRDEERDLYPWASGDDFGLVRLASSGALSAIVASGGAASPLHADRARVPPEDDVVAVDADATAVTLVTTHDESDKCPDGRGGSSVYVTRVPRASGASSTRKLAPAACNADVGPFWSEALAGRTIVAWSDRASRADGGKSAPIAGFSWRALDDAAREGRVAQPADMIADAGCEASRCIAVALVRAPGADGMSPEPICAIPYP